MRTFVKKIYFCLVNFQKTIRNIFFPTAIILLYHRIAVSNSDPYRLCVSPENFRSQLNYLKNNYNVIPLNELVQNIINRTLKNKSISITFDDGYSDNYSEALDILAEYSIPATIFVVSGKIDSNESFSWDKGRTSQDSGRPLNQEELARLRSSQLVEIGAHTINHPNLSKINPEEQINEIVGSKNQLEKLLGQNIISFAYPFGSKDSFTKETTEIVKNNFNYACSNIHERITTKSNIFALPRFIVRDWDLDEFIKNIKTFI